MTQACDVVIYVGDNLFVEWNLTTVESMIREMAGYFSGSYIRLAEVCIKFKCWKVCKFLKNTGP